MPQPLLSPADRRALIEAPLSITRSGGRGWSGASFAHLDLGLKFHGRSVYYEPDARSPIYPDGDVYAHAKP